ncbi:hypothetical protein C8R44DRAFT_865542 [Mycena epipterygia]|nr:hypothetical protein C8R44DRAFT_865542 [Mycena epipterygia]
MRVHKSAPVAPSFRPSPPTRLASSSFLHRVKVSPPRFGRVILDLPISLPLQSPFCMDSSNGRKSQLWHDNSHLLSGISLRSPSPCRVPPSSPIRLQPRVQTFVPLTVINDFRPHLLPSLAIVLFICAPSFGLPGHISIDSALSLRNKLLLGSISPQQQLQYQQVARRNHNTYVSSPPPTFPVFPVVLTLGLETTTGIAFSITFLDGKYSKPSPSPSASRTAVPRRPFVPSTSTTPPAHDGARRYTSPDIRHCPSPEAYARGGSMRPEYGPDFGHGHGYAPMMEGELVRTPTSPTSLAANANDSGDRTPPATGTPSIRGGGALRARLPRTIFAIQDGPSTWLGADDDEMGLESVSDADVDDGDVSSASHAVSTKLSHGVDLLAHGGGSFMWRGGDRGWNGFGDRPDAQEGREDFKHRRRTHVGVSCGATEHAVSRSRLRSSHRTCILRLASHLSTVHTLSGASTPRVPRPQTSSIALLLHKLCMLLSPCASHPRLRPSRPCPRVLRARILVQGTLDMSAFVSSTECSTFRLPRPRRASASTVAPPRSPQYSRNFSLLLLLAPHARTRMPAFLAGTLPAPPSLHLSSRLS